MTQDATQAGRARRGRPGPVRRVLRLLGALASGVLALVILAAGAAWLRLASGPVSLDPYLPEITAIISDRLPGGAVEVGGAAITLGDGGAELRLSEVTLSDDEIGPVAHVPLATGAFRLRDIAQGVFDPSNVVLSGVSVELLRRPEGAFEFGFAGEAGGQREGAEAFRRLLTAATADTGEEGVIGELPEARGQLLRLADTSIHYDDRLSGREYETNDASLVFWRGSDGVYVDASLTLDSGRDKPLEARLSGRRAGDGSVEMSASLINAEPGDLADQITALDWMRAFDAAVDGEVKLAFTGEGDLTALSGEFRGGAGRLRLAEGVEEPVDSTRLAYDFIPEEERFVISLVEIRSERLDIEGAGFVEVNRDEAGEPEDIVAQLEFRDVGLTAPEFLDAPLSYDEGQLTGRLTISPLTIEIGQLRLARGPFQLSAAGVLRRDGQDWAADVAVTGRDFALDDMLAHWPRQAATGALTWMQANMDRADISDADAVIRLGGGGEDQVKIDFTFSNAVGAYLAPMPPIRDAVGAGQVDLSTDKFTLSVDEGYVDIDGAEIALAGSSFVTDITHPESPSTARIIARGPTAAALALIDEPPLSLTSQLGAPLDGIEGEAEVRAVANFPLLKDLLLEQVEVEVEAVLTDLALVAPGIDKRLTAERAELVADTSGFEISGDVALSSVPASARWVERFDTGARTIDVKTRLTPDRLAALGLEQDILTEGSADVTARLSPRDAETTFSVDADLGRAGIDVAQIGWRKAAGDAAKLTVGGAYRNGAVRLDKAALDSGSLVFDGAAEMSADGGLRSARAGRFQFRGGADLAFDARREDGGWSVDVDGRLLDLTAFSDVTGRLAKADDGPRGARTPARVSVKLDELRLSEGQFFRDVEGRGAQSADGAISLSLAGDLLGGGRIALDFDRGANGAGNARLRAADAGRFLRDAGIFDDGSGGDLLISADIPPGERLTLDGAILVRDIVIHDDAKLEQMLNGADLDELRDEMRADGIVFRSIRAPFSYTGDSIRLSDAVAKGSAIGVTVSGDYQIESGAMDFDGVFTPLYAINSLIGKVPVVGKLLTGGDGQGVFAFNFAVRGNAKDPKVSVNPLSVLAPGALRRVFDAPEGGDVDAAFAEDERDRIER